MPPAVWLFNSKTRVLVRHCSGGGIWHSMSKVLLVSLVCFVDSVRTLFLFRNENMLMWFIMPSEEACSDVISEFCLQKFHAHHFAISQL